MKEGKVKMTKTTTIFLNSFLLPIVSYLLTRPVTPLAERTAIGNQRKNRCRAGNQKANFAYQTDVTNMVKAHRHKKMKSLSDLNLSSALATFSLVPTRYAARIKTGRNDKY